MSFVNLGIILESDPKLPSVSGIVSRKQIRGSWWAIPKSKSIWNVLNEFCERTDALRTKLVSGKVNFVHRKLWKDYLAIATSREAWQMETLSKEAVDLLKLVDKKGTIRTDDPRLKRNSISSKEISKASRELEKKLLIHEEQVHTESGFHARVLSSWKKWSKRTEYALRGLPNSENKVKIRIANESPEREVWSR